MLLVSFYWSPQSHCRTWCCLSQLPRHQVAPASQDNNWKLNISPVLLLSLLHPTGAGGGVINDLLNVPDFTDYNIASRASSSPHYWNFSVDFDR